MNYVLTILIQINIYVILAASLNLLVGYTGLLSLNHAAFFGVGAYCSAILVTQTGLPFVASLLFAVAGSVLLSFLISLPSLRLRGDYFVLASLGFQIVFINVTNNLVGLTGGPYGISDIPRPELFGLEVQTLGEYFFFTLLVSSVCVGALYLIGSSPFGRTLKSIREDEVGAATLGKNVTYFKVRAFAISAGFAAIAGALFSGYLRHVDPQSFLLMESIFILSIIIIGGSGNIIGPLIGTVVMILLPEILKVMADLIGQNVPGQKFGQILPNIRQIIYGLLIIIIMRKHPQGLAGEYEYE